MSFEERDHTADILMHIRADGPAGLFADAGHALMKIMYKGTAKPLQEITITAAGPTLDHLLHGFLSDLLFESEVRNLVCCEFEFIFGEGEVTAILRGEPFNPSVHGGGAEVKGISWHGLFIKSEQDGLTCDILFDV